MAVATQTSAGQRRVVYGLNVALTIVVAAALTGIVIYLGDRFSVRKDLTGSASNTLSPRTRQVLANLDQDVQITALYAIVSEYQKFAKKRQDTVRDMLNVFEGASRKVSARMIDPLKDRDAFNDVLKRIREKPNYKNESAEHQAAIEKFGPLVAEIAKAATDDAKTMQELLQSDPKLGQSREFQQIALSFTLMLAPTCEDLAEKIETQRTGDIPRYGRAIESLKSSLPNIRSGLEEARGWFAGRGMQIAEIAPATKQAFQNFAEHYGLLGRQIDDLLSKIEKLKPVKLDQIADALGNAVNSPPIIVETANEARVVPFDEVWEYRQDDTGGKDRDDRVFNGEEALLSAVLGLTSKEKVGVVFVRYGGESPITPDFKKYQPGMPMPTAPFIQLKMKLEKLNFEAADWDVQTVKTPPAQEGVARTVYVVLPPTPPPQQNPMRPQPPQAAMSPDDKQKVFDAISASGAAVFLADSTATRGPGEPYAYGEYLRNTWGIDVKSPFLALAFAPSPSKPGLYIPAERPPTLLRTGEFEFTDHPIGNPLRSSQGALNTVAPVQEYVVADENGKKTTKVPAGVTLRAVAETPKTDTVWAFDDVNAIQQELRNNEGARPNDKSLLAPFPVIMSATNDKKQRIVVFGSVDWARDEIAQARGLAQGADGLVRIAYFPANTDLFTNTLFWLLGDEGRIAIGTRTGDVPRLDKLTPGMTARLWKGFLVAGWPALALAFGGIVALARRR